MLTTILGYIVLGFLGIRASVVAANVLTSPLLFRRREAQQPAMPLATPPKVSILIPARNEAHTLPALLTALQALSYPTLEILLLDDDSTDGTADIAAQFQNVLPLRILRGKPLPAGWLGKHYACHTLAQSATGAYFLYLDADIQSLHPQLVHRLLAQAQTRNLALVSVFPDQKMDTLGEQLTVPIMHHLLLTLLPLWLIFFGKKFPSMAAANGQCMFFEANAYRQHQWHAAVKDIVVEDIAIMQRVKQRGLHGMTFLANGGIGCRMYQNYREGLQGFGKNLLAGFGNAILGLCIYCALVFFVPIYLLIAGELPFLPLAMYFCGIIWLRIGVSLLANQSIIRNIVLHIPQQLTFIAIAAASVARRVSGKNSWKGRTYSMK